MSKIDELYPTIPELEVLESAPVESLPPIINAFFEGNGLTQEQVIEKLSDWYSWADAKHRGIKAELEPVIEEMERDIKFMERKKEFIKKLISCVLLPGPDVEVITDKTRVFYKATIETTIVDPAAVPIDYCKVVEPVPEKKAIKKALEAGIVVPGARLTTNYHLQIKAGGPRGVSNSKARMERRLAGVRDDEIVEPDEMVLI